MVFLKRYFPKESHCLKLLAKMSDSHSGSLALERTRLANERTVLAYGRTSLSLLAASVLLVEFLNKPHYRWLALGLAIAGVWLAVYGFVRFIRLRGKLQ